MRRPRPRHSRRLPLQPTRGKHELLKDLCSCINEHLDKSLFSDVLDRWASTESERTDMIDCYIRCLAFKALMNDTMAESLSMPAQIDALWHEHVLETQSYVKLMQLLETKYDVPFVHHSSRLAKDREARALRFSLMCTVYGRFFPNADMKQFIKWDEPFQLDADDEAPQQPQQPPPLPAPPLQQQQQQQQQGAGEEGGDADPPPPPVWGGAPDPERNWEDGLHLNLRVRATDGQEIHFRIKETTRLEKLMNAYCQRLGQNIDAVRFMFDGEAVAKEQTCREIVGLGDGGLLDAMLPQTGC